MKSEQKILIAIFVSYIFCLLAIVFVSGYNGLYGQDSHEYLAYCKALVHFFNSGTTPGDFFWPVGYPLTGALLSVLTGPQLAMQLIPILSAGWIVVLISAYLFNEFPGREKEISLFTILFLGFSPYFLRFSVSIMSDIPATAFLVTSWYFADRYIKLNNKNYFFITSFMISAAIFTRIAIFPLSIPIWVFIARNYLKRFQVKIFLPSMLLICIPMAFHFYFKGHEGFATFHHSHLSNWSLSNFISSNFTTIDGTSSYSLPNLLSVLISFVHPGFIFTGSIFIFLIWYNKRQPSYMVPALIIAILSYVLFLCGIPFQNTRFMVPVLPFFMVICFPSFLTILSWFHYRKKSFYLTLVLIITVQGMFAYRAFLPFYRMNMTEQELVSKAFYFQPKVIYTFGIDGALRSYGYKGEIINLFNKPLNSISDNSLLIFNQNAFRTQWKDRNPMINFDYILNSGNATLIKTCCDGWEFYEIHNQSR